jgi:hypothetical protein
VVGNAALAMISGCALAIGCAPFDTLLIPTRERSCPRTTCQSVDRVDQYLFGGAQSVRGTSEGAGGAAPGASSSLLIGGPTRLRVGETSA